MDTADEVISPPSSDVTPLPMQLGEKVLPCSQPTPMALLGWIAKTTGAAWFPSEYASATGTDRDALDEPLTQLRMAGFVRIATWVRGVGQGYVITSEGENALSRGAVIPVTGSYSEPPFNDSRGAPGDQAGESIESQAYFPMEHRGDSPLPLDTRSPVIVPALLIANVLWFLTGLVASIRGHKFWTYLISGNASIAHLFGSVVGDDLLRGQWWRLLASCFVHAGGIHLLVNLFALAMVGPLAELLWGRRRLVVIYLCSGLAGTCLAMALNPQNAVVGASGAIWGILISVCVWFVVFRAQLPTDVVMDAVWRLTLAIGVNVGLSFLPGISWEAHLGGAMAGLATALLFNARRYGQTHRRRIALGLLFTLPVLSVGGLVVVMGRGQNWVEYRERIAQDRAREQIVREQAQQDVNPAAQPPDQEVITLLNGLSPEAVVPAERAAVVQLLRPKARRNSTVLLDIEDKLRQLKSKADRAVELLAPAPGGVTTLEPQRTRAKEFAEARSQSFALLLELLEADTIPKQAAWTNWGNTKHKAQTLWDQLRQK